MSSLPYVVGEKLAEGLRKYFTPQDWNRVSLQVDPARYWSSSNPVYVNLVIRMKGVTLAVLDPLPEDFFATEVFVPCSLRANFDEILLAYRGTLDRLLGSALYELRLPEKTEDLLALVDVEKLTSPHDLRKSSVTLAIYLETAAGTKRLLVEPVKITAIYKNVDVFRMWREAKNPDKINFCEFLGGA